MVNLSAKPFQQSIRIAILRLGFIALLPLIFLIHPAYDDSMLGEVMEQIGVLLIIAGVVGRFWSILYIGGHKNRTVIQSGPYSICRHPLYLFSTIAVLGFGLMLQGVLFAIFFTGLTFLVLTWTARREEAFLRAQFGPVYDDYAARTPRILPRISNFQTDPAVTFQVSNLKGNFFDALVFVALIPLAEFVDWVRESGWTVSITLP